MSAVTKSSFPRRTCRSWPGPSGKPRKEPSPRHQRSSDALLVGVGRCAACGYPLSHSSGGARGYTKSPLSCPPRGRPVSYPARISLRRADVYVEQALLHWGWWHPPSTPSTSAVPLSAAKQSSARARRPLARRRPDNRPGGRLSQLSPTVSPTRRSDPTRTEHAAEPRELTAERRCARDPEQAAQEQQ